VITMVVFSFIWIALYSMDGFFNLLLKTLTFGLVDPIGWLQTPATAMPAIILMSAWQGFGFQMVIYLAGLQSINPELYEAAKVDGATAWQRFTQVTMPSLRNTHVFVLVTTTIAAFKLFTQVNLMTKGGPNGATRTTIQYIYESSFQKGQIGIGAAASVVFFVVVLAIAIAQRFIVKSEEEVR
jgi:multiple sugar transport system permease protein